VTPQTISVTKMRIFTHQKHPNISPDFKWPSAAFLIMFINNDISDSTPSRLNVLYYILLLIHNYKLETYTLEECNIGCCVYKRVLKLNFCGGLLSLRVAKMHSVKKRRADHKL